LADSPDATLLRRRARRRLVGAIAAVVFVVVILPLVLDQEQQPVTQPLTVQIPSQNTGPFNARSIPPPIMPAPKAGSSASLEEKSKAVTPDSVAAEPAPRTVSKNGTRARPKEPAKTGQAESKRAAALLNDLVYFVPLGAFANADNAAQVQGKATGAGVSSYTEKVRNPQGEQIRVRGGPFSSREAAEKARAALKSIGLDVGQVVQR
jgi:DedD protein